MKELCNVTRSYWSERMGFFKGHTMVPVLSTSLPYLNRFLLLHDISPINWNISSILKTRTRTRTHTHTHTHTHERTHARSHARTHTHARTQDFCSVYDVLYTARQVFNPVIWSVSVSDVIWLIVLACCFLSEEEWWYMYEGVALWWVGNYYSSIPYIPSIQGFK